MCLFRRSEEKLANIHQCWHQLDWQASCHCVPAQGEAGKGSLPNTGLSRILKALALCTLCLQDTFG